jgi:hypothetical protein
MSEPPFPATLRTPAQRLRAWLRALPEAADLLEDYRESAQFLDDLGAVLELVGQDGDWRGLAL